MPRSRYDAGRGSTLLNWLLEDAEIGLPALNFAIPLLVGQQKINCTIKLSCAGIHLGPMNMNVDDRKSAYEVDFEIQDLSHTCSGDLWIEPPPLAHLPGNDQLVGKRHRLGIQIFTPTSQMTQRTGRLPSSISVKSCKARVHYTDESFRLINDDLHVITALDQEVLNALAPWFGPLVMDPLLCLGIRSATVTTSFWTNILRLNTDWFIREELPHRPDSIGKLEETVTPRLAQYGPQDTVLPSNNAATHYAAALSRDLLAAETLSGQLLINEAIRKSMLEGGPGSRMILAQNASLLVSSGTLFDVDLSLFLQDLWIQGLDSFRRLTLLEPVGNYSLRNKVKLADSLIVNATFHVRESYSGSSEHVELDETFSVELSVDPMDVEIVLLAALDRMALENLTIGSLADAPLSCVLGAFANLSLAELRIKDDFALPSLRIKGADDLFGVSDAAIQVGRQLIASPLWALVQSHGDAVAQTLSRYALEPRLSNLECPRRAWPPQPHRPRLFSWNTSTAVKTMSWFVEDFIGVTGALNIGQVARWTLGYVFGNAWDAETDVLDLADVSLLLGPFDLRGFFPSLPPPALAEVNVEKIRLQGLSHIAAIMLHPDPTALTDVSVGCMARDLEAQVQLSWRISGVAASGKTIADQIVVMMGADTAGALATCRLLVDVISLEAFQLSQLLSTCAASIFPEPVGLTRDHRDKFTILPAPLGIDSLGLSFENVSLTSRCINCSSPYLEEALAFTSRNTSQILLNEFLVQALPALAGILANATNFDLMRGANVNYATNNLLSSLQEKCFSGPSFDEKGWHPDTYVKPWWLPPIKAMMIAMTLLMLVGFAFAVFVARRKSSVLRDHQSARIATTLLRTDFLNTGGSSATHGGGRGADGTPMSFGNEGAFKARQGATEEESLERDSDAGREAVDQDEDQDALALERSTHRDSSALRHDNNQHERLMTPGLSRDLLDRESNVSPREVVSESDRLYLLGHDRPMISHPSIGRFTGVFIAALLGANFALFVSGNFFTLGRVTIFANFAGDSFREIPMITLTLDYCIDLLAEGHAFLFFLFIGFCSGVLPWLRVAMLAYAWVAPANVLTVEHRGYLLRTMESMGKWIMAIIYVFMIMTASMRTSIVAPAKYMPFLDENLAVAYFECVPMWGFISFLLSAALSTFMNHLILFYHDRIVMHNLRAIQVKQSQRLEATGLSATLSALDPRSRNSLHAVPDYPMDEALEEAALEHFLLRDGTMESGDNLLVPGAHYDDVVQEHEDMTRVDGELGSTRDAMVDFSLNTSADLDPAVAWMNQLVRALVGLAVLMWPIAFVLSFSQPVYEFEFMGLAGIGADLFGVDEDSGKIRRMSLTSLMMALPHADPAGEANLFAELLLLAVYVLLIVIAPALGILVALVLWFVPVSSIRKHQLLMMFRISNAWNSTNVICATLLVMSLEVFKFFDVVASGLTFCPQILGRALYEVGVPLEESVCFGVTSRIDHGWYILLGFVAYSFFLTRAVFYYVADDMNHDFDRCTVFLM
ncbi:Hypothetical Protein FCC1311_018802 [Hondaea fermentalgiana]|uniref:Uncharacterized protein n=1 Tax=Hondaea fermentalgiana TaxID=2315210 RepID=A0A2R5GC07_9STRA|nr:Hypothetical Protein FCC1311_018802 [Hondaea fermentalgiana]|eukprot:GBG25661.1 Hypothetical Protein FCC1311_018802 [Hondaea fermentalgiana]